MNSPQDYQTDLEVILEFLEEHYRQESHRKALWDMTDLSVTSSSGSVDTSAEKRPDEENFIKVSGQETQVMESLPKANISDGRGINTLKAAESPLILHATPEKRVKSLPSSTTAEKGKKLRLFHFLFEMLEDPDMAHCVSWVPASVGVFRFSAKNKEHVAELWGQRKGNRMPMTYQKMSRALRNYSRSGEIIKVKKKLTYQFSVTTLSTLQSQRGAKKAA